MTQDTGKYRKNTSDQFYTSESVAKSCVASIMDWLNDETLLSKKKNTDNKDDNIWIEPSAGTGVFLRQLSSSSSKIGLDIDPKSSDIIKQDYLSWNPDSAITTAKRVIVFGNPPFGRQSSLAKAFIAKSCSFADIIAFILPKSFTKPSMYNAFHRNFHIVMNKDLEKNAFILNGAKYDVPCVFQIWEKRATPRSKDEKVEPIGFHYVKIDEVVVAPAPSYDIALRRVGGLAGKCYPVETSASASASASACGCIHRSVQSHYFIRFSDTVPPSQYSTIIENINKHTFPSNTVGPRSLSKTEVSVILNKIIHDSIAEAEAEAAAASAS